MSHPLKVQSCRDWWSSMV